MEKFNYFPSVEIDNLHTTYPILKKQSIWDNFLLEVGGWSGGIQFLLSKNPFNNHRKIFEIANFSLKQKKASIIDIKKDFRLFKSLSQKTDTNFDENFWNSEIAKLETVNEFELSPKIIQSQKAKYKSYKENKFILRSLLHKQWSKLIEEKSLEWELNAIEAARKEFLEKLSKWLDLLQKLNAVFDDLSIEPGLLFDLSEGNFSLSDIEQLKKWVEYISNDEGVKRLCDIMGRLRRAQKTSRKELVKNIETFKEYVPDTNSREEIAGIVLGRDIEHVIPQELALLSDEQSSILFDLKFIEGRLMCFEMEGINSITREVESEIEIEVEEDDELGPIIVCVDTSGSMMGAPETIAKAITLFMATRASGQNRKCYLINFSTGIETLDLSGSLGIPRVLEFLQRSFHGGTDAFPALYHAIELMMGEEYKNADLLMISDFIMDALPQSLEAPILKAKTYGNKFYSLTIGELFLKEELKSIFDDRWVYNSANSTIHSIGPLVETITSVR